MWFWFALGATVISSFSIIINKRILKEVNSSVLLWTTLLIATPFVAFYALQQDVPYIKPLFLVSVILSVGFYTISKILRFRSFRLSNLSDVYPLVAFNPVIVLIVATLPPLKERPSFLAILGMIMVIGGIYVLNMKQRSKDVLLPLKQLIRQKGSSLMLLSIFLGATVIVFDKIAIKNTLPENPSFTLLVENILVVGLLFPFLITKRRNFIFQIKSHFKYFLILGALNAFSTIIYFSSISKGNVALVSTIVNSKVLFVVLLSAAFFGEKITKLKAISVVTITLGIILMKIYGG